MKYLEKQICELLKEIEKLLENKITDLLIEKNIKKGYSFKYSDIAE